MIPAGNGMTRVTDVAEVEGLRRAVAATRVMLKCEPSGTVGRIAEEEISEVFRGSCGER